MVKRSCLGVLYLFLVLSVFGFEIEEMEFVDQPVQDILFTLARVTGNSIITDSTVTGKSSYYFRNTNLETALEQFLPVCNLSFRKSDGVYYVSRLIVRFEEAANQLTLYGRNIDPRLLIEKIAEAIGKTILFTDLPDRLMTINVVNVKVADVLEMIIHPYPEYNLESYTNYFFIRKTELSNISSQVKIINEINMENGVYSVSAESIRLSDALILLFKDSGKEYSLMKRGDTVLENIYFSNKTFDELLRLFLEMGNSDFTVRDGVYYIFDISRNEIMKKLDNIEYIKLKRVPVELLPALFPSGLAGSSIFKIDKENNAIILSGSSEETTPVREFITKLEAEYEEKQVLEIELSFLTVDELLKLLPARLQKLQIVRTGSAGTLIVEAAEDQIDDFISFTGMIDISGEGLAIPLKYIRAEDLLKNLPPSISETDIVKSADPNLVFFKGSKEKLERFLKDLEYIDKPVPQIRYELLIVQYQESKNKEFGITIGNEIMKTGSQTALLGSLGNLINLNLDIVTTFGYLFAVDLNAKISNSEARIMADTTLNGLTGEKITFQNTNTYRYRDMEIDPDTGEAKSTGVTREITSGLIISIDGWVSGDEMITMDVNSTVSKRGADVSSNTGNPPPTSEKVISTHVRTPSGKPVIISGLLQHEKDIRLQKTPLLSDIPLLGWPFTSRVETVEDTELVIYIVPYIEYPDNERLPFSKQFKEYYESFFKGGNLWN